MGIFSPTHIYIYIYASVFAFEYWVSVWFELGVNCFTCFMRLLLIHSVRKSAQLYCSSCYERISLIGWPRSGHVLLTRLQFNLQHAAKSLLPVPMPDISHCFPSVCPMCCQAVGRTWERRHRRWRVREPALHWVLLPPWRTSTQRMKRNRTRLPGSWSNKPAA